ncbi:MULTISPECIES: FAD-dependent oxidoreductase [Cyanophyceae]|uniref:FAD-dependent oxidoreductase n=1 Tax=Cyanophyceae TaxID=3028117 RepID=UPI0002A67385|nr:MULTISPECIES: FAD-dependent oxidoreductase [Cyanophyceae]AFZ33436.1 Glutathione-disulfide reductase [Gloeocapsa sp. PCC 7428]PPS41894.1 glutathione-disulfide reductase [Chroococcidiopsis sp. TS-821]
MSFDYDLFVIGAGPGGLAAAERAAHYGARVAIAERDQVGGTCVVHGCVPEKMMTYAAGFSHILQNADEYGWNKVPRQFDWSKFAQTRDENINHLSQVHVHHLQTAGVELMYGDATFLNPHTLKLGDHQITANKVLIAVGARSVTPDIPGINDAITMRELLELKQQPDHLAIIGSNHIATKFAGIMNGLVCKVTQIVAEEYILPNCDLDLRTTVQTGMIRQGIQVLNNTHVSSIEQVQEGLQLEFTGTATDAITVNTVVYATDRVANIDRLNLEAAGVEVQQGAIVINDYGRTTQPHIFAVGDCTPRPQWTPAAIAAGRAFADFEFGKQPHIVSFAGIPYVVATMPEAATIGLTETQAREKLGESVRCYRKTFQPLFNLIGEAEQEAMLKLVVDSNSDRVLGVHMVGECAAEVIQMLAPALKAGVTKQHFDESLGIHPSVGEEFFTLK